MTEVYAKPIIEGRYWIIEEDGEKIAILQKKENNKLLLSSPEGELSFNNKADFIKKFSDISFLDFKPGKAIPKKPEREIFGYPTSCVPHNATFNIKSKLPLFTKSRKSKSMYCAGYFLIKFNKGWTRWFCPKVITIERYPALGPFKTKNEMIMELTNVNTNINQHKPD